MGDRLFINGANVILKQDNDKLYGMTCAWASQVDYSKALLLIGSQSETGRNLKKGDLVSISGLASDQKDIAIKIGTNHSSMGKFKDIDFDIFDGVKVIKGAKTYMKCKIIDIMHLERIEEDSLIYLDIIKFEDHLDKEFISYKEFE